MFAPKLVVEDRTGASVSIQNFLQNAYLAMSEEVVRAVGDLEGVIGFELMNEPHKGYVGLESLHRFDYNTDLHISVMPSALQSFLLGAGHPTLVPFYSRSFPVPTRKTSEVMVNPDGHRVWRLDGPTGGRCIWEIHNVWQWDRVKNQGVVLREHYFVRHPDTKKKVDWYTDFYFPFLRRWTERIRSVCTEEKIVFVEAIPNEYCPPSWTEEHQLSNMVYAPHWYDLYSLFLKSFGNVTVNVQGLSRGMFLPKCLYWGHKGACDNFSLQIQNLVDHAHKSLGEKPVIIGECGIPMDMNNKEAFKTGDFTWQARMMDAMITGIERSLVGFALWTYNPLNTDKLGDDWNGENFSWFSLSRALPKSLLYHDQNAPSLDQGARILNAIVRPYPAKVAGSPVRWEYDMNSGSFEFEWDECLNGERLEDGDASVKSVLESSRLRSRETEIFIPSQLTLARKVVVEGLDKDQGDRWVHDEKRQTLFIVPGRGKTTRRMIRVRVSPPLEPSFEVLGFWDEFGGRIFSGCGVLVGLVLLWLQMVFNRESNT